MLQIIDTGETFTTRKEAKNKLGNYNYMRLLKAKKIQFINDNNTVAINGKLHTITNEFN